jgi:hypothetical protein
MPITPGGVTRPYFRPSRLVEAGTTQSPGSVYAWPLPRSARPGAGQPHQTKMKSHVRDPCCTAGWLVGFGYPLWLFPYTNGSAGFIQ